MPEVAATTEHPHSEREPITMNLSRVRRDVRELAITVLILATFVFIAEAAYDLGQFFNTFEVIVDTDGQTIVTVDGVAP